LSAAPKAIARRGPSARIGLIALCLLGFAPGCWADDAPAEQPAGEYRHGVLIRFEGTITPMLQHYFFRKLEAAKRDDADLVVVEIDSPGGYLDESLEIAARLRDLPWAHTVAYVPHQALSGAAIVALGCDEIIMAPNAVLGNAGPIFMGEDFLFRHAPEKIRSDLARKIRDLAKAHGRPPALAEAMVDMDLVVYRVENSKTGRTAFMTDHEIDSSDQPADWKKIKSVHESRKGKFLEVNGARAVELGLAEANLATRDQLEKRYELPQGFTELKWTGVDTAVYILNLPVVTGLLFVVGLIALYIEFMSPGIGVGGLTAVLCFALFFWSRFLGGTAGWLEVVLFAAGLMFLAAELFVIPGFGVSGVTGILLLLASVIMASQGFVIPETPRQLATMTTTLLVVALSGAIVVAAAVVLSSRMGTLPVFNRLVLKPPAPDDPAREQLAAAAAEGGGPAGQGELKIGDCGVAQTALRPAGKARFGNRYADVVTDSEFINKLSRVEIVEIIGNRMVVREIGESAAS